MPILFLLLFLYAPLFAQNDQIILPDVDLIIEDQSSLETSTTEIAELQERSPQFQSVYVDELFSGISDSSLSKAISQQPKNRYSFFSLSYGSFNNTQINAYSQNLVNNLFYKISYQGEFQDNSSFNGLVFPNTGYLHNDLDTEFSYITNKTIIDFGLSYRFNRDDFFVNSFLRYDTHYIPFGLDIKHWIDNKSYIQFNSHFGVNTFANKTIENNIIDKSLYIDGEVGFSYHINPKEWNYTKLELEYIANTYNFQNTINQGRFTLVSEFLLGKGFGLNIGGMLGVINNQFLAWPELKLYYQYFQLFMIDFAVKGDFTVLSADLVSREKQFFDVAPNPEAYWEYSSTISAQPNAFVQLGATIFYKDFNTRRIYVYDASTQNYSFNILRDQGILGFSAYFQADDKKIVDFSLNYRFQDIPSCYLLESPHYFDVILGLGYRPVGFRFEIQYQLWAGRNLGLIQEGIFNSLNMKVSQSITEIAEVYISVNNILNQNTQFLIGNHFGGIQAYGGLTLKF